MRVCVVGLNNVVQGRVERALGNMADCKSAQSIEDFDLSPFDILVCTDRHTARIDPNQAVLYVTDFRQRPPNCHHTALVDWISESASDNEFSVRLNNLMQKQTSIVQDFWLGPFHLIPHQETIFLRDHRCELTRKDYQLACYFFRRVNTLCSRDQILKDVWGIDGVTTRTVDVHVSRIRKALCLGAATGVELRSINRSGYMLTCKLREQNATHSGRDILSEPALTTD